MLTPWAFAVGSYVISDMIKSSHADFNLSNFFQHF